MQLLHGWLALALVLGLLELASGTFYLLVIAAGCLAGALAAWLGGSVAQQLLVVAVVGLAGWAWLRSRPSRRNRATAATGDPAVLLDVGERVAVAAWDPEGRAQVRYRGAAWTVELDPAIGVTDAPKPGVFVIRGVAGNRLLVAPAP